MVGTGETRGATVHADASIQRRKKPANRQATHTTVCQKGHTKSPPCSLFISATRARESGKGGSAERFHHRVVVRFIGDLADQLGMHDLVIFIQHQHGA